MKNNWLDGKNLPKKKEFKRKKVNYINSLGSRMVYDEVTGEYAPRFGNKSVKKNADKA